MTFILPRDVMENDGNMCPGRTGKPLEAPREKVAERRNVDNVEKTLRIRWEMEDFWLENKLNTP